MLIGILASQPPTRIIQIQLAHIPEGPHNGPYNELFALCEDGSLWLQYVSNGYANVPTDDQWRLLVAAATTERNEGETP